MVLEARDEGGIAVVDAVATARCGRRHDATRSHADLLTSLAGTEPPEEVWLPAYPSADGRRELAACTRAFGDSVATSQWSSDTGYAPGWTSLSCAANASVAAGAGKRVIATAYGGAGTTVAIRLSPPS